MKAIFRFRNITNNIVKQKRNSLSGESASGIKFVRKVEIISN